jgi:hypothetical protein
MVFILLTVGVNPIFHDLLPSDPSNLGKLMPDGSSSYLYTDIPFNLNDIFAFQMSWSLRRRNTRLLVTIWILPS